MPLVYTPDLLFEGFSLSKVVLLDSQGREMPDGIIKGVRSSSWEPDIETFDEFSHEKLINVWSDIRRVNFSLEAGYTSMAAWAKITGSSIKSEPLITNLLTPNQASGTDTLGDTTGFTAHVSSTLSSVTSALAASGSQALQAVASAGTGMTFGLPSQAVPVVAGQRYTARVKVGYCTAANNCELVMAWYDRYQWVSQVTKLFVSSTGTFVEVINNAVVPVGAEYMSAYLYNPTTTAGVTTMYADEWGLWKGTGGNWAMPGQPITGLTGLPSNYADRLPLYEHGRTNAAAFPVRLTFPARDANGKTQELALTLFKVKFQPPKQSGAEYKAGQSVSYQATAMLSATDETGALLDREAFGRIDRAYSVG